MTMAQNKVNIINWTPHTQWINDCVNNMCTLCKNNLQNKCVECEKQEYSSDHTCNIIIGRCGHGFHYDCFQKLNNDGTAASICPIDNQSWMNADRKLTLKKKVNLIEESESEEVDEEVDEDEPAVYYDILEEEVGEDIQTRDGKKYRKCGDCDTYHVEVVDEPVDVELSRSPARVQPPWLQSSIEPDFDIDSSSSESDT